MLKRARQDFRKNIISDARFEPQRSDAKRFRAQKIRTFNHSVAEVAS